MRSIGLLIIAFVAVSGCAVGTTYVKPETNISEIGKVAVMPFTSNKAGLGVEVANRLTGALLQLNRFQVVESTPLMEVVLRSTEETLRTEDWSGDSTEALPSPITTNQFAETLGVDAVLTGSIRRYGNWFVGKNMNIDSKLISANGSILWTCNYKTDWAFTGLGTEGSLASKVVKETMKRFKISLGLK